MPQRFHGVLQGNGLSAKCICAVDFTGAPYLPDDEVTPSLPDGEYDLEVNGIHMRAVRADSQWTSHDY